MTAEDARLDQEERLHAHIAAWRTSGSEKRLRTAVRMLLLRQTAFSAEAVGEVQQVLSQLYARAGGYRLAGLGGKISPSDARDQLQSILVPVRRGGRPLGGAPLVADAVSILLEERRGRSAGACLRDSKTRDRVHSVLLGDRYPRDEIKELLDDASGALRRALDRAIRRR